MLYLILFGVVAVIAAAFAAWCRSKLGGVVTILVGILLTVATLILFYLNKSDSVADTFLEKLADMSPPLITAAVVVGWWLGFVLARTFARMRR